MTDQQLKKDLYTHIKSDESVFDFMLAFALDGLWYCDVTNPQAIWINPTFWNSLGYNSEKIPTPSDFLQSVLSEQPIQTASNYFEKFFSNLNDLEEPLVSFGHIDGSEVLMRCRAKVVYNQEHEATHILVAHTKQKTNTNAFTSHQKQQIENQDLLLQNIYKNFHGAIFSVDTQYCYTSFNETYRLAMKRLYGSEITLGMNATEYFTNPEEKEYIKRNIEKVLKGERVVDEALYGLNSDAKRWYEVSHQPVLNEEGEVVGVAFFAIDIDEKKKINLELQYTKELLEQTNTAARIGTWEMDLESFKTTWSKVTAEIHGVEIGFASDLSNGISFFKAGESRQKITNAVNAALAEGIAFDLELPIITAKGKETWVRAIGLTEYENGICKRFYGTFQDINDRKSAEMRLQEIQLRLKLIAGNFPDGSISLVDEQLNFLYTGGLGYGEFGINPEELIGRPIREVLSPEIFNKISENLTQIGENSKLSFEIIFLESCFQLVIQRVDEAINEYFVLVV
ncbi:MAG: PAS domain S-box protein, partial [Verrucomicrobia bacterium]|nr:PAS domain S-box protein [Cytophagales bacterium]